jgi:hypothetical protein
MDVWLIRTNKNVPKRRSYIYCIFIHCINTNICRNYQTIKSKVEGVEGHVGLQHIGRKANIELETIEIKRSAKQIEIMVSAYNSKRYNLLHAHGSCV